jgi:hypothetical protein
MANDYVTGPDNVDFTNDVDSGPGFDRRNIHWEIAETSDGRTIYIGFKPPKIPPARAEGSEPPKDSETSTDAGAPKDPADSDNRRLPRGGVRA